MANNNDTTGIKSTGKTVENESTAEQRKKKEALKEKAKADAKRAKEKREAAEKARAEKKDSASSSDSLKEVAAAAAAAALAGSSKKTKKGKKKLITTLIIIALLVVAVLVFAPRLKNILGLSSGASVIPGSLSEMQADEVMGYNKVDFQNAILGDPVAKQELIVMEQPVEVESEISQALANISLFKKTKTIRSFGTGVYTVTMEGLSAENIAVDENEKTVTVTIPHAVLQYINKDLEKTEFETTEHALLSFGELKMTTEQQNLLDISIEEAMREVLDTPEQYALADETALLQVREVFQPLVSAISEEYIVAVVQN